MTKAVLLLFSAALTYAASLTDADIEKAIQRGKSVGSKKLWADLRKRQQFRINRAGLDPVEKKVLFLFDKDRIALESSEAKRQVREISVDYIKTHMQLNVMEIMLEANLYNSNYSSTLPKWGPPGVHLVLKFGETTVQPEKKIPGEGDAAGVGLLYRVLYERYSLRSWYLFQVQEGGKFTVIVIAANGNKKEKEIDLGSSQFAR